MRETSHTVSTTCVSRWDQVIPSAYADGTDCAKGEGESHDRKIVSPSQETDGRKIVVDPAAAMKSLVGESFSFLSSEL